MSTKKTKLPPSAARFAHLAQGIHHVHHEGGGSTNGGVRGDAAAIARQMNAVYDACHPAKGSRPVRDDGQPAATSPGSSAQQIAQQMVGVYDRATGATR